MSAPYFKINGTDILRFVQEDGMEWSRNDLDNAEAGRTMDGTMHRGRVAIKYKVNIRCLKLYRSEVLMLMNLILPEFVTVETNMHPLYESCVAQFYSNNVPSTVTTADPETGESLWSGISFPLVER